MSGSKRSNGVKGVERGKVTKDVCRMTRANTGSSGNAPVKKFFVVLKPPTPLQIHNRRSGVAGIGWNNRVARQRPSWQALRRPESMPPEQPKSTQNTGLLIQGEPGSVTLPNASSSALSEIIKRSLVHIWTNQLLAARHRAPGEESEFEFAPGVMIRMCWIPLGVFRMESQLVTTCHQLRMTATDGKQRLTSSATAETLVRLMQRVPSPTAEPVKLWPAKAGNEFAILANIVGVSL